MKIIFTFIVAFAGDVGFVNVDGGGSFRTTHILPPFIKGGAKTTFEKGGAKQPLPQPPFYKRSGIKIVKGG